MGIKKVVTIRHIRGETFDLEVERDADCLGLKLLIFEARGIALERQRLVYAGKEMADVQVLSEVGIENGSTIFLVETADQAPVAVQASAPVVQPVSVQVNISEPVSSECQPAVAPVAVVAAQDYVAMNDGGPNADQILLLNKYVRRYCWFCLIISLTVGWVAGLFNLVPILCFAIGLYATRRLHACSLWAPIIYAMLFFVVLFAGAICMMIYHFNGLEFLLIGFAIVSALFGAAIFKLYLLISKLSAEQLAGLRARVDAQPRCCGCCW